MEVMEVATAEGADLVGCEEDEQHIWSLSAGRQEEEDEEGLDEGLPHVVMETDSSPIRILPIPIEPLQSRIAAEMPLESAGPATLNFRVNGHLVSPEPGGGSTELILRCHPGGSASGFTSVTIPVTLTVHSPERPPPNRTSAGETTPAGAPTPIITGVVSGEAAHKVLTGNNVKFSAAPTRRMTPPPADTRFPSPHTSPPSFLTTKQPASVRHASSHKMLHKGELGPVSPPDCVVCRFQYKLISELRGFMCMCSPAIAQSLKDLKKKGGKNCRRSREENKTTRRSRVSAEDSPPKGTSSLWKTHRPSDDRLSESPTSPARLPPIRSPTQVNPTPPQGKLVILVEDFYYGSDPGRSFVTSNLLVQKVSGSYDCARCEDTLPNNIRLMSHMLQHEATKDPVPFCPHCLRHFLSVLTTQRHVERVHRRQSSVTCRICELAFGTEPDFLWHMKTTHKPGEMPYTCQVCDFRSSFFSGVWTHFQDVHAGTRNLLCHYCLRVLRSPSCYQQHLTQHQSKQAFSCYKCRLHFLYNRERLEHEALHHKTHIKPPQLSGLKPGTKVTVRTYSMVGSLAPSKVVDVPSPPFNQPPQKRRKMESLGQLLWSPGPDSVPVASILCVECRTIVPDLQDHFPSLVHCSLCRFSTCCSTSYANHMINHHIVHRKNLQHAKYQTIFTSNPRVSEILQCVSCTLSTHSGDVMANHLIEQPEHTCIMLPIGPSVCVDEMRTESEIQEQSEDNVPPYSMDSVTSSGIEGGVFLPIGLPPAHQTSSQLSVKPLTSPSPLSSPAAMTIKFLGPKRTLPPQVHPLSRFQLAVVLSSLCHGVCQAALRFRTSPMMIRSWIEQQQCGLPHRKRSATVEPQVKWVLSCRENQLSVNENILLLMARSILRQEKQAATGHTTADGEPPMSPERDAMDSLEAGRQSQIWEDKQLLLDCYNWSVDFMLREELGLQNHSQPGKLPDSIMDRSRGFIQSLRSLIQIHGLPPHSVACLDEFPVFMNSKRFFSQDQLAFQLSSPQKERPLLDVVLSALSDGTLLPPLLFFNGVTPVVPEGFPNNVLLEARAGGFTNLERLEIWIDKVWHPYVSSHCRAKSLLMLDSYRGHLNTMFRDNLSSMSTMTHHFPTCCCCRLQPLEVCVVPVLKDFLQARWTQLVSEGGLEGLSLKQLALTLACWLSEVTSTLSSQTHFLLRSFSSVFDLQQLTNRSKVVKMIAELSKAVTCPLEARGGAGGVNEAGGVGKLGGVGGAGAILHIKQEEDQSVTTMADMTKAEIQSLEELGGGDTAEEEQPLVAEEELKEVKHEKELLNGGLSTVFQFCNGDSDHKSVNGLSDA